MAKIIYGNGVSEMRGKQGGSVYSKNAFGTFISKKSNPKTNRTQAAYTAKGKFLNLAQMWSATLTQAERDAWNAAKINFPQTNVFGQTILLTGFDLFQKFNGNLRLIEQPEILLPPAPVVVPLNTSISVNANLAMEEVMVSIAPYPIPASALAVIYATAPFSQGVTNYNNRFRFARHSYTGGFITQNNFVQYIALFGSLIAGQKIAAECWNIDINTGIESGKVQAVTTIQNYLYYPLQTTSSVGSFIAGETVNGMTSGASGIVNEVLTPQYLKIRDRTTAYTIGETIIGVSTGATAVVQRIPARIDYDLTPEFFYPTIPFGQALPMNNTTIVSSGGIYSGDMFTYSLVLVPVAWNIGDTISQVTGPKTATITNFQFL